MMNRNEIARNWLPRYTGTPLEEFPEYILLTNFDDYVKLFSKICSSPVRGEDGPMQTCTSSDGVMIINFGIGSPNAATIMDLLGAVSPRACLFLGKCGGLKEKTKVGDLLLPIAAIRGEGTSDDYFDSKVPALPSFGVQKALAETINLYGKHYWSGTVYTTNRRLWEHDEEFKSYLNAVGALGIDMECATLFLVGFANDIPKGALLLVTDQPMVPEGVKTAESDKVGRELFTEHHLRIGIDTLLSIRNRGQSVKHLIF